LLPPWSRWYIPVLLHVLSVYDQPLFTAKSVVFKQWTSSLTRIAKTCYYFVHILVSHSQYCHHTMSSHPAFKFGTEILWKGKRPSFSDAVKLNWYNVLFTYYATDVCVCVYITVN
jgi:hypothetical protein